MTASSLAAYDLYVGLDASKPANPAPANGRLAVYQASDTGKVYVWNTPGAAWFSGGLTCVPNYLTGLTLSCNGVDNTTNIAAGAAADTTNVKMLALSSSLAKTTAAWAVGSTHGGLDTGAAAINTWYHVYLIYDGTTVDALLSLSVSAPTMPGGYTYKRRIGSVRTNASGNITPFTQVGDEFLWTTPSLDYNVSTAVTVDTLITTLVPPGVSVWAKLRALFSGPTAGTAVLFWSPDIGTQSISNGNLSLVTPSNAGNAGGNFEIRTNTSGQIYTKVNLSGSYTTKLNTFGWIDRRGKDG